MLATLIDGSCVGKVFSCLQSASKSSPAISGKYSDVTSEITIHCFHKNFSEMSERDNFYSSVVWVSLSISLVSVELLT